VLFSTGVAYGPVLYYGSARIEHNKILRASIALPLIDFLTSIVGSIMVFSYIGHIADTKDIDLKDLVDNGPALIFVSLPSMIGLVSGAQGWCTIFYLMCICYGIATVFGCFSYYMQLIKDAFPQMNDKIRPELQVAVICLISFLFSLMFVNQGGFYNFVIFDRHSGSVSLIFVLFLQTVMIPWVYGLDKLCTLIKIRTDETVPKFVCFIVKTFVPLYSFAIFIIAIVDDFQVEDLDKSNGGTKAGTKLIWILPILIVAVCAAMPLKDQETFDHLVISQYGIKFDEIELTMMDKLVCNDHPYTTTNDRLLKKRMFKNAEREWKKTHNLFNINKMKEGFQMTKTDAAKTPKVAEEPAK